MNRDGPCNNDSQDQYVDERRADMDQSMGNGPVHWGMVAYE